jgi:hypothetical protein
MDAVEREPIYSPPVAAGRSSLPDRVVHTEKGCYAIAQDAYDGYFCFTPRKRGLSKFRNHVPLRQRRQISLNVLERWVQSGQRNGRTEARLLLKLSDARVVCHVG